ALYTDEDGNLFPDNDERAIFFAKGVIETVKKLNWAPDIIHVHGWMASLLPLYLREYYKNDTLFSDSKIVTSIYNNDFKGTLGDDLIEKIKFDSISEEKLKSLSKVNHTNLIKIAIENSDAVIKGSENLPKEIETHIKEKQIPVLEFQSSEDYSEAYSNFYLTEVL
ncbi:MAG: glycogen/starch synthase, partial [Aureibaculum sp.]